MAVKDRPDDDVWREARQAKHPAGVGAVAAQVPGQAFEARGLARWGLVGSILCHVLR